MLFVPASLLNMSERELMVLGGGESCCRARSRAELADALADIRAPPRKSNDIDFYSSSGPGLGRESVQNLLVESLPSASEPRPVARPASPSSHSSAESLSIREDAGEENPSSESSQTAADFRH